jgi:MFS family permease
MRGYCLTVAGFVRSLNPRLPRSVQILQLGGLANAFGNGVVLPFTFIYLHNVRGIGLGTAGLVLGTNAAVSLVAGPISGALVDRVGAKRTLGAALLFLTVGYSAYAFIHHPWQGFLASVVTGVGNGAFWPAQSSLIAGLIHQEQRTPAFAMQRVVMNLGIGLGALTGGLIASTAHPRTFELLFLVDAATFVAYLIVLWRLVPQPARAERPFDAPPGGYAAVLRDRAFLAVITINTVFIFAGFAGFDLLSVYSKNEAGVNERAIGIVFLVNTLVIVVAQMPIAKLAEGHRRMRMLALLGLVWAGSWLLVPLAGLWLSGWGAAALLAVAMAVFGIGECLHGSVQAPLTVDLADPVLLGRYMALSALSWMLGFALGPAVGGYALALSPHGTWLAAAAICAVNGLAALAIEPALPTRARRTPLAATV